MPDGETDGTTAGCGVSGARHARQHDGGDLVLAAAQSTGQQVTSVGVAHRVEVAGTRGIGAVGHQGGQVPLTGGARPALGQAPREPVVRQADGSDTGGVLGFVVRQPAQLGDGEGGDEHAAHGVGPGPGPGRRVTVAELADEVSGGVGAACVVPQERGADDLAVGVEADHAVLLAAHGQSGHVGQSADGVNHLGEGGPPVVGVDLGAVRVAGPGLAHERTGGGVTDDDLAGLGRGVDAGDERHNEAFRWARWKGQVE